MTEAATAWLLARLQFAFTISFHSVFLAFSIGRCGLDRLPPGLAAWWISD